MAATQLNVAHLSGRGHKYAIVSGKVILRKFKTPEEAKTELKNNESFYKYWAESASVAVDNSRKITIIV